MAVSEAQAYLMSKNKRPSARWLSQRLRLIAKIGCVALVIGLVSIGQGALVLWPI